LIAFIAHIAGVAHADVSILRGAGAQKKVVRIASAQPSEIARRLSMLVEEAKQR
jgi:uncharacterized protein YggU (UPF0235/DUF167 family)